MTLVEKFRMFCLKVSSESTSNYNCKNLTLINVGTYFCFEILMKINGSIITNFSHSRASRVQVNSVKMPFYGNLVGACDNCTQIEEMATL